jgi:hypothetical protein
MYNAGSGADLTTVSAILLAMGAAQTAYKEMLRDIVAPVLRAEGFKGSGGKYELPDLRSWALLGCQTSDSSTGQVSKFTVNLQVIDRMAWEEARMEWSWLAVRPSPNVKYRVGSWDTRIGHLLPEHRDHWWHLAAGDNPMTVANQVLEALLTWGIPALRAEQRDM